MEMFQRGNALGRKKGIQKSEGIHNTMILNRKSNNIGHNK